MNLDNQALIRAGGIGVAAMAVLGALEGVPFCSLVCCLIPFAYIGVGAGYSFFANRNANRVGATASSGALGGAIAAALSGLVYGLVSGVSSMLFMTPEATAASVEQMRAIAEQMGTEVPPEYYQMMGQGPGPMAIISGACCGFILAAILGAIGGAILAATSRRTPPTAIPPAPPAM